MSEFILKTIIPWLWMAWLAYWIVAARNVKATRWNESFPARLLHLVPFFLAVVLLDIPQLLPSVAAHRVLPASVFITSLGAVIVATGLGFSAWARRHLGRNWSGMVTLKKDHSLIRTGPYKYIRHPIYTGILCGFLGTALAIGEWRGILAVVLVLVAFVRKLQVEEARMREIFPEYEQYRQGTAALIPFVY